MARQNLGAMLAVAKGTTLDPDSAAPTDPVSPAVEPVAEPVDDGATNATTPSATAPSPDAAGQRRPTSTRRSRARPAERERAPQSADTPRYLTLQRKEARITVDQADALTAIVRRLNRTRRGSGERITDNTLLRVAVELLLSREDQLAGTTEDELRASLGLSLTE